VVGFFIGIKEAEKMNYLTDDLKRRVRQVFEPRYKRRLNDDEISDLAISLTDLVEAYCRIKSKECYGKTLHSFRNS